MTTKTVISILLSTCMLLGGCDADTKNVDSCGDGFLDPGEQCDTDVGNETCLSLGYYRATGRLSCTPGCAFDVSECGGKCGDGLVDPEQLEQCDSTNLAGNTCQALGYPGGTLACGDSCRFDTSMCTGGCGDGVILRAAGEQCEASNLDGQSCEGLGYWSGALSCDETCHFDVTDCATPVQVGGGFKHTCALMSDGRVLCWGYNGNGQLGDGTSTSHLMPEVVPGLEDVIELQVDYESTCVLRQDGTVWCWGMNIGNQPTQVGGLEDATDISTGRYGAGCAQHASGALTCWSWHENGAELVAHLDSPPTFTSMGHNGATTCIVHSDGTILCRGHNASGELGDGTTTDATDFVTSTYITEANRVEVSHQHVCGISTTGEVFCWGDNTYGLCGNDYLDGEPVGGLSEALDVKSNYYHSCALTMSGNVRCWGHGGSGRLGDGTTYTRTTSVAVVGINEAVAVGVGDQHSCAILADHSLFCWGYNANGQLGNGLTENSLVPVEVLRP